jgi:prepilin-type N-terminal cleavage/methylation domain-containing protein
MPGLCVAVLLQTGSEHTTLMRMMKKPVAVLAIRAAIPQIGVRPAHNNKESPTKNAGVSLIEILISMLILSLIMGGFANLFLSTKRNILHIRSRTVAGELDRYFLDRLQMDVRQDEWGSNCLSSDGTDTNCDTTAETIDNMGYTPQYEKSLVDTTTLRKVKLTITWTEPSP